MLAYPQRPEIANTLIEPSFNRLIIVLLTLYTNLNKQAEKYGIIFVHITY